MNITQASARQLIEQYFDSFNQGRFEQTAALFSQTGELSPPFEGAVAEPERILEYLNKQARGMSATAGEWIVSSAGAGQWQVEVLGKVKALVFQVNVTWHFLVTATGEIESANIKLVASPKELLSLRSAAAT